MSAIFGIIRFDDTAASSRELERMGEAMAHRGPDGRKVIVHGQVGLGHGLMRVNNEDLFEAQPLYDRERGLTLVADCRIDNREELADRFGIGSHDLTEWPDSALILRAYKTWGEDCAEHLVGDFAFAVWDERAKKLVLVRDHMGQRFVHYHRGKDFLAFATEIRALWALADVPRELPDASIARLLVRETKAREGATLFAGIDNLPGGTVMAVHANGTSTQRRYWEPRANPAHEERDAAYYIETYRHVLSEAVACRIRRTLRQPGIVFSGGYDSAGIAALAGPVLEAQGRKLIAAASVMPADYRGTIRHARPWVDMCARAMPHLDLCYITREGKNALSGLDRTLVESDHAPSAYHFVARELLSAIADRGAQLVMDGHGGDYTLNPRGQAALAHFFATLQFRRFISELRAHVRLPGQSLWTTIKMDLAALLLPESVMRWWKRARHGTAPLWGDTPIKPDFARKLIAAGLVDARALPAVIRPQLAMREQMAAVCRRVAGDPAPGMAVNAARLGLEITRPFHDKRVVELALAIPQDLYVKNGRNRYLACAALKDLYPPEFQTRWRRNDDEIPDFQRMVKSIEPQLLAEIARMEKSEHLSRHIDFRKVRELLAARGPDDHNSGWEQETQLALKGILVARFVESFQRKNR